MTIHTTLLKLLGFHWIETSTPDIANLKSVVTMKDETETKDLQ